MFTYACIQGDSGGKAGTKLHIIGGKPLKKVHFIPKHPFGEFPSSSSTLAPQQQLAMQQVALLHTNILYTIY
jgi:hypothetical protein